MGRLQAPEKRTLPTPGPAEKNCVLASRKGNPLFSRGEAMSTGLSQRIARVTSEKGRNGTEKTREIETRRLQEGDRVKIKEGRSWKVQVDGKKKEG